MRGCRAALLPDGDLDGVAHVLRGDTPDGRRHRGGEQRDLAARGGLRQDPLDVIDEAHLQHLVAFIQHHEAQGRQIQRAALHMVHDPTRGRHDDLGAALQPLQLRRIALAAVDRQHMEAGHLDCVLLKRLGDLDGQLARGHHHQGLWGVLRHIDASQNRQGKRRGLAGARLGLSDNVFALEHAGNGLALDGRGGFIAHRGQSLKQEIGKTQLLEAGYFEVIGHGVRVLGGKGGRDCTLMRKISA